MASVSEALQYFDQDTAPLVLGSVRSLGAATNIVVGAVVFFMSVFLDYRAMFLATGLVVAGTAVWGLSQNPVDHELTPQRKHMVFRWRYRLFYFIISHRVFRKF